MKLRHAIGVFFVICAGAKTENPNPGIFGAMDVPMIDLQWTVDKVLQRWPKTFSVFTKHKTKCVGCFMQQFCTLKDVAETYQLSVEKLIDELNNVSDEGNNQRSIR
jgi:hybrid cluster-associated redox disulfide protein